MSIRHEQQEICRLCVIVGQKRPHLAAEDIAKNVSKLYRIAVSLVNRGYYEELEGRATSLARMLGCHFRADGRDNYFLDLGDAKTPFFVQLGARNTA